MSKSKAYYRLQQLDSDIDAKTARVAQIEVLIGQRETVDAMQAESEAAQHALNEAQSRQRDQEWELDQVKRKLNQVEQTMYSGSVRNPKELEDLRRDSEHLRNRRGELQDRVLEAMMNAEELGEHAGARRTEWQNAEQAWADEQQALQTERQGLQEALAALQVERAAQAGRLDAAGLAKYNSLRGKKGGVAVVLLQGTVCSGCRISLPSGEVQKVRADAVVSLCPHCGHILAYGGPAR